MSGSRSIAAARSRRAGETTNIVSGGRPVTSIASQSAFVPQQNYQQPNRGGVGGRGQQQQQYQQQHQQHQQQQQQPPSNGLPFTKLSISDAIGLITLRLGRVEQFIIDTEAEDSSHSNSQMSLPENSKIIDSSLLTTIINRLDSLEKKEQLSVSSERLTQVHTELTATKELLLNLTSQFDTFVKDTSNKFADFELGITEIEKVIYVDDTVLKSNNELETDESNNELANNGTLNDANENTIVSVDLKTVIKEELSRTSE